MVDEPRVTDSGATGEQRQGERQPELLPADVEHAAGLQAADIEELLGALPLRKVWQPLARAFGRYQDRLLHECERRNERLAQTLADERVAHATTKERLRTAGERTGAQTLLVVIGSAVLGWAFGKLFDGQGSLTVAIVVIIGLLFATVGSWPLIKAFRG